MAYPVRLHPVPMPATTIVNRTANLKQVKLPFTIEAILGRTGGGGGAGSRQSIPWHPVKRRDLHPQATGNLPVPSHHPIQGHHRVKHFKNNNQELTKMYFRQNLVSPYTREDHYGVNRGTETENVHGNEDGKDTWPISKPKRVRTIFTQEQLEKLEEEFAKQQYMVGTERYYLASELNLTQAQVKVWFQNRRIKWRKQNLEAQQAKLAELRAAEPDEQSDASDDDEDMVSIQTFIADQNDYTDSNRAPNQFGIGHI
uniref:Homeobox protein not2-like n=1 Tax=Saccoglossus kowalevskii TaxID=10224 RepID=A0ABM0MW93_SACKO|nr:PREDICTED: homeobox protein not2-like [Saccoglossus kowalevskii]